MCGICGIIGMENAEESERALRRMTAALVHRGPDEDGFLIAAQAAPRVALAMRRLSIIDLPGGTQPIFNETSDVAVFQNGEIYNFPWASRGTGIARPQISHTIRYGSNCSWIRDSGATLAWNICVECLRLLCWICAAA